jgi:TRAP-type transport system periplasmic protein
VTYGIHKLHHFHTLSNHFYISRPIFLYRTAFDGWPADLQDAMRNAVTGAIAFQRDIHVGEEEDARRAIEAAGCKIEDLDVAEHAAFAAAVNPIYAEARAQHGDLLDLVRAG